MDFSCAVFDPDGNLVANAPHMPVHLGSMSDSVRVIIKERGNEMRPGDVYALNAPYNGGTHLPDVTLITPVFDDDGNDILFFVGSRGHQADIGGITPGSMPPDSVSVDEEGILIDNFLLVERGAFRETAMRDLLGSGDHPARNPDHNIADLKDDPHAIAREMVVAAPDGDGEPLEMEGIFPKLSRTPGEVRHAGRDIGSDNAEIFGALGLSADDIATLEQDDII